jgi:hypothetical protein
MENLFQTVCFFPGKQFFSFFAIFFFFFESSSRKNDEEKEGNKCEHPFFIMLGKNILLFLRYLECVMLQNIQREKKFMA